MGALLKLVPGLVGFAPEMEGHSLEKPAQRTPRAGRVEELVCAGRARAHLSRSAPSKPRLHECHAGPYDIRIVGRAGGQRGPAFRFVEIARG